MKSEGSANCRPWEADEHVAQAKLGIAGLERCDSRHNAALAFFDTNSSWGNAA